MSGIRNSLTIAEKISVQLSHIASNFLAVNQGTNIAERTNVKGNSNAKKSLASIHSRGQQLSSVLTRDGNNLHSTKEFSAINQKIRQVSLAKENKSREIRELEQLEAAYFSIHRQEHRYYQELIDNHSGSKYLHHFIELDQQADHLHQIERQRLEDMAERLVDEEVALRIKKDTLFNERKQLFSDLEEAEGTNSWV